MTKDHQDLEGLEELALKVARRITWVDLIMDQVQDRVSQVEQTSHKINQDRHLLQVILNQILVINQCRTPQADQLPTQQCTTAQTSAKQ